MLNFSVLKGKRCDHCTITAYRLFCFIDMFYAIVSKFIRILDV